jgi:hypothetical protein
MDWINDRIDKMLGISRINQQFATRDDRHSRRMATCAVAWKRLADTLSGDVARFNARSPRRAGIDISQDQVRLRWEDASGALLLVIRSPKDAIFTYSSPRQEPNNWLQQGGTIQPRSERVYAVRDSMNLTKTMGLDELSEALLGPPLFDDIPIVGGEE